MKRIFINNPKATKHILHNISNQSIHYKSFNAYKHCIYHTTNRYIQHIAIKKKQIAPSAIAKKHKFHIDSLKSIKGEHYTETYCNVCKVSFPSSYQAQQHLISSKHAKRMLEHYSDCFQNECIYCNVSFADAYDEQSISKQKHLSSQQHHTTIKQLLKKLKPSTSLSTEYLTDPKHLIHVKGIKGKHYTDTRCHVCDVSFDGNSASNTSQHLNGSKHIKNVLAHYSGDYHHKCIYCNASCSTLELKHAHESSPNHSTFIHSMIEETRAKYLAESEWILSLEKCQKRIGNVLVAKKKNPIQIASATRIRKAIQDCYEDDSVSSVEQQLLLLQKLCLRSNAELNEKDYVSILICISSLMRINNSDIIGDGLIKICKLFADHHDIDSLQESKWKMDHKLFEQIIDIMLLSANVKEIIHEFDELIQHQNTRDVFTSLLGIEAEQTFLEPFGFLFAFFNDQSRWKSDCFESKNAHQYFMKWSKLIFYEMMYELRDIRYYQQIEFDRHYKRIIRKHDNDCFTELNLPFDVNNCNESELSKYCSFTETKRMDYGPCTNIIMSTLSPFILSSFSKGSFAVLIAQDLTTNAMDIKHVLVGYIYKMSATSQTLSIRIANHRDKIQNNCRWHILCRGASAASFESQFESLRKITSGSVSSQLGSILYGNDANIMHIKDAEETKPLINTALLSQLNTSQRAAVQAAISNNITLIQGPPGTGKTHVAAAIVEQFLESSSSLFSQAKILLSAYTNIAVDVLTERVSANNLSSLRIGYDSTLNEDNDVLLCKYPFYEWAEKINTSNIICATSIGTGNDMLKSTQFDLILIDETTQSTESGLLVALSKLKENGRIILIGDHKQLPPTVRSMSSKENGLNISLFERLINDKSIQPNFLNTQYRMHPILAQFPSTYFYEGELLTGITGDDRSAPLGFDWPSKGFPIAFVQTCDDAKETQSYTSTRNEKEAAIVIDIVRKLVNNESEQKVTVISPYVAQKKLIESNLEQMLDYEARRRVKVRTVDGFQGSECDVIVFSATRCNNDSTIGFLRDYRRVNVMLTRCKNGLIVVGDRNTLSNGDPLWRNWMQYVCNANKAIITDYIRK